ncbi:MAG TPA: hypothetical protein VF789_07055 [Thermoanaerobaculia bacterium]
MKILKTIVSTLLLAVATAAGLAAQTLEPASATGGGEARALSADGRWMAFERDGNVFLYDRNTRTNVLVSRAAGSTTQGGNGPSSQASVSADGRYVVFGSMATDLAAGTPDAEYRFFLFDRLTGAVRLVGRTGPFDGPGQPHTARISADGNWVAFTSFAPNLVAGQQEPPSPSDTSDVFLWSRETGSTSLVSRTAAGAAVAGNRGSENPLLSSDGRYIAFYSFATDLVPGQGPGDADPDLLLFDRTTGKTVLVARIADPLILTGRGAPAFSMSADGRFLVYNVWGDEDLESWLYDRTVGTPELIHATAETPRMSADGRYVVFRHAIDFQLYLWDRSARTTTLVSRPNPAAYTISSTGRYVSFLSADLGPAGQTPAPEREAREDNYDLFLVDRTAGTTVLISRSKTSPSLAAGGAEGPLLMSAGGEQVAFTSAVDFAAADSNHLRDAYLFSLTAPTGGGPTPLPPCKLLDTRRRADRPALRSDTRRTVRAAGVCGVPSTAKSVSVTVTALQGTGKGNLRLYAGNDTVNSSGILRFEKNATRSATFNVPLATNGAGTIAILPFVAGKGTVQVIVEVNGYSQ